MFNEIFQSGAPGVSFNSRQSTAILRLPTPRNPPKSMTAACGRPLRVDDDIDDEPQLLAVGPDYFLAENPGVGARRQRLRDSRGAGGDGFVTAGFVTGCAGGFARRGRSGVTAGCDAPVHAGSCPATTQHRPAQPGPSQ